MGQGVQVELPVFGAKEEMRCSWKQKGEGEGRKAFKKSHCNTLVVFYNDGYTLFRTLRGWRGPLV